MINIKCKGECSGCGACAMVCPTGCISMIEDSEGFRYPNVEQSKCIDCGKCDKTCQCQNPICSTNIPEAFACYNLRYRRHQVQEGYLPC